jgi:hypothetical protein
MLVLIEMKKAMKIAPLAPMNDGILSLNFPLWRTITKVICIGVIIARKITTQKTRNMNLLTGESCPTQPKFSASTSNTKMASMSRR